MKELFILSGPTGIGKTNISIKIAKNLNCEIISCDSMQIYKYMDIGSAKVSKDEMQGIPHHLIDIIEPNKRFSVVEYKMEAEKAIDEIISRNKLPMLVGGTGLYINSLIFNYTFTDAYKDDKYRSYLEKVASIHGRDYVHSLLKDIDEISYNKIHPNNLKRVIRALEVYKLTGKPFSSFNDDNKYDIPYNIHYYVLNMDRAKLYERINKRVDDMIDNGLVDEVKKLKEKGYTSDMQSMKGIGYKEILYYLNGDISFEDAVDMIKQGSRNYAKRQLTWFRRDPRVIWINKDDYKNDEEIANALINDFLINKK